MTKLSHARQFVPTVDCVPAAVRQAINDGTEVDLIDGKITRLDAEISTLLRKRDVYAKARLVAAQRQSKRQRQE